MYIHAYPHMLISYTGDSLVNLQQKLLYKDRRLQKGLYKHTYVLVPSYCTYRIARNFGWAKL